MQLGPPNRGFDGHEHTGGQRIHGYGSWALHLTCVGGAAAVGSAGASQAFEAVPRTSGLQTLSGRTV